MTIFQVLNAQGVEIASFTDRALAESLMNALNNSWTLSGVAIKEIEGLYEQAI